MKEQGNCACNLLAELKLKLLKGQSAKESCKPSRRGQRTGFSRPRQLSMAEIYYHAVMGAHSGPVQAEGRGTRL